MRTEAFALLGPFARWLVYGARSARQNALPAEALWPMIEKSISLTGFSLAGSFDQVPRVLRELFTLASDGSIKVEITRYPLAEAGVAHSKLEGRKSTGKLVLIP